MWFLVVSKAQWTKLSCCWPMRRPTAVDFSPIDFSYCILLHFRCLCTHIWHICGNLYLLQELKWMNSQLSLLLFITLVTLVLIVISLCTLLNNLWYCYVQSELMLIHCDSICFILAWYTAKEELWSIFSSSPTWQWFTKK